MTKGEMAAAILAETNDLDSKAAAARCVDAVFGIIKAEVKEFGEFRMHGFGTFKKKTRAARKGRNPHTGEEIQIEEKEVVKFKAVPSFLL